jgi:hypothetical protein
MLAGGDSMRRLPYTAPVRSLGLGLRCVLPWLVVCVVALGAVGADAQSPPLPTLVVQIKFKPGAAEHWKKAFQENIVPSIQEAIDKGDEITRFAYFEAIVPGQPYDFLLLLQSRSFGFFDQARPAPHYKALFRRVGPERGEKILEEMGSWEQAVSVSLLRGYEGRR